MSMQKNILQHEIFKTGDNVVPLYNHDGNAVLTVIEHKKLAGLYNGEKVDLLLLDCGFGGRKERHPSNFRQATTDEIVAGHRIDDLQKQIDAANDVLTELKEKSEALYHRWHIFSDSVALAEAEMIDMCVKEIEQALNTEVSHG
ncbi:hypothetical protein [Acinetobacter sp. Ac_5812]|uniref:hypothetical protein n=1 Tax=Acinetobacter sp. Ac_5812 TaxID=1848937 RepID=UPI00149037A1|nr:hypothetical protein [Acinetobacter sp. Ac_5812]NNP70421.1 hypothetical protein [Acinetobacter sp. Ac_5812]